MEPPEARRKEESVRGFKRPRCAFTKNVRNQSQRTTYPPQLIVLHSTESHDRPGDADLRVIAEWFDNPQAAASSHVVVDREGNSAQLVDAHRRAWTQARYNDVSLSIEQIGWSRFSKGEWLRRESQLKTTAKWIAYWSRHTGIPIRRGQVKAGRVVRSGVITHAELGELGGNHGDPGKGYPFWRVLAWARFYRRAGWK